MSLVNVINVIVLNPKSVYSDKISFEIFFEALQPLQHSKCSTTTHLSAMNFDCPTVCKSDDGFVLIELTVFDYFHQ